MKRKGCGKKCGKNYVDKDKMMCVYLCQSCSKLGVPIGGTKKNHGSDFKTSIPGSEDFNLSEKFDKWKYKLFLDADGNSLYKQDEFHEDFKQIEKDIKTLIKIDTKLIADYISGKISANELWNARIKLCGEELSRR